MTTDIAVESAGWAAMGRTGEHDRRLGHGIQRV